MAGMILDGDDDEDEDEEILQLKLQEIQAKLKLKKLQSARAANGAPSSRPDSGADSNARRPQARTAAAAAAARAAKVEDARPRSVEVPASPVKKAIAPPKSPMKVQLGIDKGLRAKDVSLRRSSSTLQQRMQDASERSRSLNDGAEAPVRPLSFSERLALKRNEEAAQVEKQKRIQQIRSSAFAVDREEIERYKAVAQDLPDLADEPQVYSRAEIVGSGKLQKDGGYLRRSSTAPSIRGGQAGSGTGSDSGQAKDATTTTAKSRGKDEASFESYSGFHLKKRILPHEIVTRSITGKQVYKLKDLLRKVKAPTWELPDDECDVVAFAILAAKSEPRSHKARTDSEGNTVNQGNRGMYMVLEADARHRLGDSQPGHHEAPKGSRSDRKVFAHHQLGRRHDTRDRHCARPGVLPGHKKGRQSVPFLDQQQAHRVLRVSFQRGHQQGAGGTHGAQWGRLWRRRRQR